MAGDKYKMTNEATKKTENPPAERRPNEQAGFAFSGGIKITDPQTGEVLLLKRTE